MTYSLDFRKKVLSVREKEGLSIRGVAKRFGIASRSVVDWLQQLEPKSTRNKPSITVDMEALKKDIELYPDGYQYERARRLGVSQRGIWGALQRLGVTYKKNSKPSQSGSRKAVYLLPKD